LLVLVYYLGAELYLIDKAVLELSVWGGVAVSVTTLALAWVLYDLACRSPLGQRDTLLAALMFVVLLALAWAFTLVFSARGAFMQMGAIMGTIMVANVAMVIIPGQRKVIADLVAGREPDPIHGKRGKQRSTHNNYLTLGTLFVMIAGHYPLAFGTRFSWLILGCLIVMGVLIRHFYNERHKGNGDHWWAWALTVALGFAVVWLSTFPPLPRDAPRRAAAQPPALTATRPVPLTPVSFAQVEEIVLARCSMCHMAEPAWATTGDTWQRPIGQPPKGVRLDTPEAIRLHRREIALQSAASHAMPPGNVTELTDAERAVLRAWAWGPR
jgi:uncharacterized membrane protein